MPNVGLLTCLGAINRQHLKRALELATRSTDNHLRALVLALIAAHYLHTAGEHARTMLQTCEQLAAGLGAPATKGAASAAGADGGKGYLTPVVVGNAPLGLWAGERFMGTCSFHLKKRITDHR